MMVEKWATALQELTGRVELKASPMADSWQRALLKAIEDVVREWKKNTVLVLGFTGAGKTSLLEYAFGAIPAGDETKQTQKVNLYILEIGDVKFKFADTPGHPTLKEFLDLELDALIGGHYQGVINVVSYGYNQSRHHAGVLEQHNKYKPILSGRRVNPRYLNKERELELEYLENWASPLRKSGALKWIITVVNKADLWSHQTEKVRDYYEGSGEYAKTMKRKLGRGIPHDVCPMLSMETGFYDLDRSTDPDAERAEWQDAMKQRFAQVLHDKVSS